MSEIEIGEYVRTKNGLIGKVNKIEPKGRGTRFAGEYLSDTIIQFNDGKVYERRVKDNYIVNHNKNIIDLIEKGDLVLVEDKNYNDFIYVSDEEMLEAIKEDIKTGCKIESILTHEQYERNCYKIN